MWIALTVIAFAAMLFYWRERNAVGGSMTMGFVFGLIAAGIWALTGHGFYWTIVWKWTVVCMILGALTEWSRPKG